MHKGAIVITLLFAIIFAAGCIELKGFADHGKNASNSMNGSNLTQRNLIGNLHGTATTIDGAPLESVSVLLIGDTSNYTGFTDANGEYNITGLPEGAYDIAVWKEGRRNVTLNFTFKGGHSYPWNVTLYRDCIYYSVNTSANYALRYGFSGTLYSGEIEFDVAYPEGAAYEIYPSPGSRLSQISTEYKAGNRMLDWTLDNSEGSYSYVKGHIYVNMNGTGTMQVYGRRELSISNAASNEPNYLGSETTSEGKTLIDPSNSEIRAIAQQVKNETGNNDTWTVARALFIWLKNNTVYYIAPDGGDYTHLPIETLHSRRGKCDELSHLYISMLRSVGIPSRFVKGYLVEKNPELYISHRWVEFYDGEWVPVEVAGANGNANREADTYFAVQRPDHVKTFVDGGTSESIEGVDADEGTYYGQLPEFSFDIYYDAIGYDQKYIAVCSDGSRELTEEME